jgi:hypothetical protein
MNEDAIDDELKCAICQQPFREPVSSTRCHHTFCRECIIAGINREKRCPLCRIYSDHAYYQPVRSHPLLNQLNRLLVRCNACQQINIQSGNFQDHARNCPNWIIPCTAADIRCAWQGPRNQLANHVIICPFQCIRPIVDDLRGQIQTHSEQIADLRDRLSKLFFGCFILFMLIMWSMSQAVRHQRSKPFDGLIENFLGLFFGKK